MPFQRRKMSKHMIEHMVVAEMEIWKAWEERVWCFESLGSGCVNNIFPLERENNKYESSSCGAKR